MTVQWLRQPNQQSARDLIDGFLTLDPKYRTSAKDALDSDYFWEDPMPCLPRELPKYEPSHEYQTRKRHRVDHSIQAFSSYLKVIDLHLVNTYHRTLQSKKSSSRQIRSFLLKVISLIARYCLISTYLQAYTNVSFSLHKSCKKWCRRWQFACH